MEKFEQACFIEEVKCVKENRKFIEQMKVEEAKNVSKQTYLGMGRCLLLVTANGGQYQSISIRKRVEMVECGAIKDQIPVRED